jgi:hypothetical protein
MYDQTVERVAYLRHEERLARVSENVRLAEIQAERRHGRRSAFGAYRQAAARALIALATRIAPTITPPSHRTHAMPR